MPDLLERLEAHLDERGLVECSLLSGCDFEWHMDGEADRVVGHGATLADALADALDKAGANDDAPHDEEPEE